MWVEFSGLKRINFGRGFKVAIGQVIQTGRTSTIGNLLDGAVFSASCRFHQAVIGVGLRVRATDRLEITCTIEILTADTCCATDAALINTFLPSLTLFSVAEICGMQTDSELGDLSTQWLITASNAVYHRF